MKYYEFKGHIHLQEPFYLNSPRSSRFPVDSHGNPIIPASTIRGWLRFTSYRSLIEVFARKGLRFSIHEHYLLAKGVDTGDLVKSTRATNIGANAIVREHNPMMDLYGRWEMAGAFAVGNGIAPKSALTRLANSSRRHILDTFDDLSLYVEQNEISLLEKLLSEDGEFSQEIYEVNGKIKNLRNQTKSSRNPEESYAELAVAHEQLKDIKSQKVGSDESIRRINYASDILDAGTSITQKMKLRSSRHGSFQFLIWTISKLPFFSLGGKSEYNYGDVLPKWTITEHDFCNPDGNPIGAVGWNEDGFICELNDTHKFDLKEFESNLTTHKFDFRDFG